MTIDYGPVFITDGEFKGRIGCLDDDTVDENDEPIGYVFLGHPYYSDEYRIPIKFLRDITTEDLYIRQGELRDELYRMFFSNKKSEKKKAGLLSEMLFIECIFSEKFIKARFCNKGEGKHLFISHSSKDKPFARLLATDLTEAGHFAWLDEWQIKVGESIPGSISKALEKSDYVLVVLSSNSNESEWVKQEWFTKYWDEITEKEVKVIPILMEECKIPELLKTKKYADFRREYSNGLEELLFALS